MPAGGTADFYRFDLAAGDSAAVALAGSAGADLELCRTMLGASWPAASRPATAPAALAVTSLPWAVSHVCVAGVGDYSLVRRNASLDLPGNDSTASAGRVLSTAVGGWQWVVGQLGVDPVAGVESDFPRRHVVIAGMLRVRLFLLAGVERREPAQRDLVSLRQGRQLGGHQPQPGLQYHVVLQHRRDVLHPGRLH